MSGPALHVVVWEPAAQRLVRSIVLEGLGAIEARKIGRHPLNRTSRTLSPAAAALTARLLNPLRAFSLHTGGARTVEVARWTECVC